MRLMRLGEPGSEIPVAENEAGERFDLRPLTAEIDGAFLAGRGPDRVRDALARGRLEPVAEPTARVGPPIARPGAVVCIGQNYAAHARESGGEPPEHVVIFFKHPNTVVGAFDPLCLPPGSTAVDWEVELAVVIASRVSYLDSPDDALAAVAGYAVANDVSERHWQRDLSGGQWSKGKTAPGFCPLGPWLLPADEVPEVQNLRLRSWVNGDPRQDSSTADMIFGVAHLVYELSQVMVLEPGDLISSGTPQGVALSGRFPYLAPGDVYEAEIDGLGRQRQVITAT